MPSDNSDTGDNDGPARGFPPPASGFPPNAIHLVRTSQQITMQLSQMADQKASILMGATFVVFTLAVGQARVGTLALPLAILATFSFLSALLAVSAVLPRVGKAPPVMFRDGKDHSNILFFGRFAAMEEDEFIAAVKARLRSEEDIYDLMLRDTYQNGVVLARRKYRYLAYAYRLFVVGLTLTFAAFVWDMGPKLSSMAATNRSAEPVEARPEGVGQTGDIAPVAAVSQPSPKPPQGS